MHASYLSSVFNRKEQDNTIREIKRIIRTKNLVYDGFVVTGVSGITMGSVLARLLKKELVIIRKDNDKTHSSYKVENLGNGKRYIFLDDLMASGNTYKTVKKSIETAKTNNWLYGKIKASKIIGGMFYDGCNNFTGFGVNYLTSRKLNSFKRSWC